MPFIPPKVNNGTRYVITKLFANIIEVTRYPTAGMQMIKSLSHLHCKNKSVKITQKTG